MKNIEEIDHLSPLDKLIINGLIELFSGEVNNIILFGSRARGDSHLESDMDIALIYQGEITGSAFKDIQDRVFDMVDELLGDATIYPVRCIPFEHDKLNGSLWAQIEKEGVLLWKKIN